MKYELKTAYSITDFIHHKELKQKILNLIDEYEYSRENIDVPGEEKITRNDWFDCWGHERNYWDLMREYIIPHMDFVYSDLGVLEKDYTITNVWYNHYKKGDYLNWHRHISSNWASIYYLHLENENDATEIRSPYDGSIVKPIIKEGQILTFPSNMYHRSNVINQEKIIIAFNIY